MSLRRAQNIFVPKNLNSITIIITLEGTEEIKTEKNDNKTVWRIFFSPALWENVNKLWNGFSILIGCLDRTIIWFSFFIGLFQRAKIYFSPPNSPALACKMRHNARQSDKNISCLVTARSGRYRKMLLSEDINASTLLCHPLMQTFTGIFLVF